MGFFDAFNKPKNNKGNLKKTTALVGASILAAGSGNASADKLSDQTALQKDTPPSKEHTLASPEKYAKEHIEKKGLSYTVDGKTVNGPVPADSYSSPVWKHDDTGEGISYDVTADGKTAHRSAQKKPTASWSHSAPWINPDTGKAYNGSNSNPWIDPDTGETYKPPVSAKPKQGTNSADYYPDGRLIPEEDRHKTEPNPVSQEEIDKVYRKGSEPDYTDPKNVPTGPTADNPPDISDEEYDTDDKQEDNSGMATPKNGTISTEQTQEAKDPHEGYVQEQDGSYVLDIGHRKEEEGPFVEQAEVDGKLEELGRKGSEPDYTDPKNVPTGPTADNPPDISDEEYDTDDKQEDNSGMATPENGAMRKTEIPSEINTSAKISPEDIPTSPEEMEALTNRIIETLAHLLEKMPGILKGKNLVTLLTLTTSALAYNAEANTQNLNLQSGKIKPVNNYVNHKHSLGKLPRVRYDFPKFGYSKLKSSNSPSSKKQIHLGYHPDSSPVNISDLPKQKIPFPNQEEFNHTLRYTAPKNNPLNNNTANSPFPGNKHLTGNNIAPTRPSDVPFGFSKETTATGSNISGDLNIGGISTED